MRKHNSDKAFVKILLLVQEFKGADEIHAMLEAAPILCNSTTQKQYK